MRFYFSLLLVAGFAWSAVSLARGTDVPPGWKRIDAGGQFSFFLPANAWDTGFSGTEEFYREYRIGKLRLMFVYEPHELPRYDRRDLTFGKHFRETQTSVDGVRAYLFEHAERTRGRTEYYADLFVGDLPHGDVKLWMQADSFRQADLQTAMIVFRTITFAAHGGLTVWQLKIGEDDSRARQRSETPADLGPRRGSRAPGVVDAGG